MWRWRFCLLLVCLLWSSAASAKAPPTGEDAFRVGFQLGKGLEIRAPHDYVVLQTRLRAQFLYTVERGGPDEAPVQSLQIRRARLVFTGSMMSRHNTFKVELAFSPRDLSLSGGAVTRSPLLDWYMQFKQLRALNLRIGQYKVPFSRERVISSGNLAMVDRSIVNAEFSLDRDVGLDLRSSNLFGFERIQYAVGVFMGEGHSAFAAGDFGLMYLTRIEILPMGAFKTYDQVDFTRSARPRLCIAGSYGYIDRAKRNRGITGATPADGGTTQMHLVAADLLFKWRGLSLHSEMIWRQGSRNPGDRKDDNGQAIATELPRNGAGWFAMLSYLLPVLSLGLSLRYSLIRSVGKVGTDTSLADKDAMGLAVSYYFVRHSMKLQADYFRIWDALDLTQGEDRVRVILQAAF